MSLNTISRFMTVCCALSLIYISSAVMGQAAPPKSLMPANTIVGTNITIHNNYSTSSSVAQQSAGAQLRVLPGADKRFQKYASGLGMAYKLYNSVDKSIREQGIKDIQSLNASLMIDGLLLTNLSQQARGAGEIIAQARAVVKQGTKGDQILVTSLTSLNLQGSTQSNATVYDARLSYSDALAGLDFGLQSVHGNANLGPRLGRRSLDGTEFSFGDDLTDRRSVASVEYNLVKNKISILNYLKQELDKVDKSFSTIISGIDYRPQAETTQPTVSRVIEASTIKEAEDELKKISEALTNLDSVNTQLVGFAEKLVKLVRSVDALGLASLSYVHPIGSSLEAGLALSRLTPWYNGRRHYGVEAAVNVVNVWFSPTALLSNAYPGYGHTSAIRTSFALYWQDGIPYIYHSPKSEDPTSKDLNPNRWHFQIGGEYQFTNVIDGADAYDFFVRYRNPSSDGRHDGPNFTLTAGKSPSNNLLVGLSVGINFASTH